MSGSITLGGGTSGTAITLDNSYVSSHLAMFQSLFQTMTAEVASAGGGVYGLTGSAGLLVVPDGIGNPVPVFGGASESVVLVGDGSAVDFVGIGNATVAAGGGDNLAIGGAGKELFALGSGDNSIYLGSGQSTVYSAGRDTIQSGIGSTSVVVTGSGSQIYGTTDGTLSVDDTSGRATTVNATSGTTIDATTISGATTTVISYGNASIVGGAGAHAAVAQTFGTLTFYGHGGSATINQAVTANASADLYASDGTGLTLTGSVHDNVFVANDATVGNGGNVRLDGSAATGGNQFWAGSGNATLIGGSGSDTLVGGQGASTLTGGGGGDQFDLFTVQGGSATRVTITDLNGSDALNLFDYGSSGLQFALAHATQQGANTVVALTDGSTITLQNFDKSELTTVIKAS